jgi:hypothetical protein
MRRLHPVRILIAISVVACTACATPPDREMQQAEAAIEAARGEGAAEYAAADLQAAEEALARARDAVALRDYRLALANALDGRERAQTARNQARQLQAAARNEADQAVGRLDAAIEGARSRLDAARGSGAAAPVIAQGTEEIAHATLRLQEARAAFARGDFAAVIRLATETLPTLDRLGEGTRGSTSRDRRRDEARRI